MNSPTVGRRVSDTDMRVIRVRSSIELGNEIFHLVGKAGERGKSLTIWDLRRMLDAPLEKVFVALRALEHERLITRGMPTHDVLSAPITLTEDGREIYFS
ncbi:hypothetical protein [Qipengyuania soli]|uniref:MarR family transcriptional regulator n=1 Tax=Qipengyuania soli TaxID=2782568 RepID=A0A7S8F681_9SPHN|nr:hypothetical protein [Qipengyuania soli]QPC99936.1 hypothetical protein IRL76_05215 [Qipengyuania soli]